MFLQAQDLVGHRRGELLPPTDPRQRFAVDEQLGAGDVGLKAAVVDLGFDVEHDAFVAKPDPEVLQAAVSAVGLREKLIQLVVYQRHGGPVEVHGPAWRRRPR